MTALQYAFWDEDCAAALSDAALLAAMARFEGGLATASVSAGLVPAAAAATIAKVAATARFDAAALGKAARHSATLTIPFVKSLTDQVAAVSPEAARYVHYGATSQDVADTGVVLCLQPAGARMLALSKRLGDAAAALAKTHASTPVVARTLLQPATPVSFGWKAAVWLSMLTRAHRQFRAALGEACVLQFGGASGTLSAFGGQGDAIAETLARELGLPRSQVTWHSARDGFARLGAEAAILAGSAGKIATDIALMMQPEIGEVSEPAGAGRGGSSAMPHKRNPVGCVAALEAALRLPHLAASLLSQLTPAHERGLGQWQGQWFSLRDLLCSAASALSAMAEVLEGLEINEPAMRANLERTRGLVFSENVAMRLGRTIGKQAGHALTERLCETAVRQGKSLREALQADPQASAAIGKQAELDALFDPAQCLGAAPAMIDRALAAWARAAEPKP